MIEKAIQKIKSEMDQNKVNPYIQVVGGFLEGYINKNPESAEKILAEGKTIAKSLDEMRKAAEKKKIGNCAVLTDKEGFEIVLKYFGIEGAAQVQPQEVKYQPIQQPTPADKPKATFDVSLDDLLI